MIRQLFMLLVAILLVGCQTLQPEHTPQTDLLCEDFHPKLLVEVTTIGCTAPDPAAIEFLKTKIEKHCHKNIVAVYIDDPIPSSQIPTLIWDIPTLTYIEKQTARFRTMGDTLVIRILYVAGVYSPGLTTRGIAYDDYAFAVFRNTMDSAHERSVLLHEFGHLIGLVNCGSPMVSIHDEIDPEHKPHCRNKSLGCVMYWSAPTMPDPDFDAACKQDIIANGGK